MNEQMLTAEQVSEITGYKPATLSVMRQRGEGPVAVRMGRTLRYHRDDVDQWIADRRAAAQADAKAKAAKAKAKAAAKSAKAKPAAKPQVLAAA